MVRDSKESGVDMDTGVPWYILVRIGEPGSGGYRYGFRSGV